MLRSFWGSLAIQFAPQGRERVDAAFTLALTAYNLIRLPKLLAVQI